MRKRDDFYRRGTEITEIFYVFSPDKIGIQSNLRSLRLGG